MAVVTKEIEMKRWKLNLQQSNRRGLAATILITALAWMGGACARPEGEAPTLAETESAAEVKYPGIEATAVADSDGEPLGMSFSPALVSPPPRSISSADSLCFTT